MNILITSGGTKIPIDRVRDITNMSSGTFGSRIAAEALRAGHKVTFLCAKDSKTPFSTKIDLEQETFAHAMERIGQIHELYVTTKQSYNEVFYRNFDDYAKMLECLTKEDNPDIIILAAAVSDYGVENPLAGKLRSSSAELQIKLVVLPKLIGQVKIWGPHSYLVGFKLLVDSTDEQLIDAAYNSVHTNHCDLVVANDLRDIKNDNHRLKLVFADGIDDVFGFNPDPTGNVFNLESRKSDPNYLARAVVLSAVGGLNKRESLK